jgi:endonuclease/exonuclease/phosphatase family metal-dependent hydrolase
MKSRSSLIAFFAAAAAALCLALSPAASADGPKPVKVMTWNLFYGFDDGPVIAAAMSGDPALFAQAATEAWRQVHATNFHKRVRDIALQIRLEEPDLIGVQEAVKYTQVGPTGVMEELDHLEILVAALREAGLPYEVVSHVDTLAINLPLSFDAEGNPTIAVSVQDRVAVLARSSHAKVAVSNPQSAIYQVILGPAFGFPFPLPQGWASVDVAASGHRFRFVTTHLEDASADPAVLPIQEAQAAELVNRHAADGLPVVFAGDFNTDGFRKWPTYKLLTGQLGLTDAWKAVNHNAPGLTWGQSPDLLNPFPRLTQRIDLVLFSGRFDVRDADVVGATLLDRVPAGMWPSDHAGLVVTLVP